MDFPLAQLLYEEGSVGVFILVTILMGGGAAWLAGRAIAATWRPWPSVIVYSLPLTLAVRFIHFALFDGTLLSPHYFAVDYAICLVLMLSGFRFRRAGQMAEQYRWIHERKGAFGWRRRAAEAARPE